MLSDLYCPRDPKPCYACCQKIRYKSGTALRSLLSLGALYNDLEAVLEKKIDLITIRSLEQRTQMPSEAAFREAVMKERVRLYDVA